MPQHYEFQDSIYIPAWSNGSPPDSKSGRLGSNPRAGANSYKIPNNKKLLSYGG